MINPCLGPKFCRLEDCPLHRLRVMEGGLLGAAVDGTARLISLEESAAWLLPMFPVGNGVSQNLMVNHNLSEFKNHLGGVPHFQTYPLGSKHLDLRTVPSPVVMRIIPSFLRRLPIWDDLLDFKDPSNSWLDPHIHWIILDIYIYI